MAQAAEQLVGRAAELGALDHALADLAQRRPGTIEVAGEPGIGKTRLLAELGARADAQGLIALSGSASELERELPFWVFVDALDEYVQALEPRRLNAIGDETLAELAHVLPSLPAPAAHPGADQDERYRTHRAFCRLLEGLAASKPLVLLLDDLHWADSGTIELLGALLRRPPAAPVLLALALRPRQLPERLAAALARAHRDGTLTRLELGALSAEEARELLGVEVDGAAAAALHAESGGNPFYLEQLARSPQPVAGAGLDGGGVSLAGVEVPRAVAAALTEELALLPGDARRLLEGASVAGDPFEPELAAAAAGVDERSAMEGLDELLRLDLVRHTEVPRRFRFRHPLVRRAAYDAAPGGWRLGAHERCADALGARGASAVERAHHVERSARRGDTAAVALLSQAGEATVARSPATAARRYAAALRLLPDAAPPGERIALLSALGRAHASAGQFSEAYAALLESIELLPEDSLAEWVSLSAACAEMENLLGRHGQAHTRLMTAFEGLADAASPEAVALMAQLAVDGLYRMEYDAMRDWARRASAAAERLEAPALQALAIGFLAMGCVYSGALEEAETSLAQAVALLDGFSDDEFALILNSAAQSVVASELHLDRYDEAAAHTERMLRVARASGKDQVLPILFWAGTDRCMRGRLIEAAELLDNAVEIARLTGHAQGIAWNLFSRSLAATAAGDLETALATAEEGVEILRGMDTSFPSLWAGFALAAALHEAGQSKQAIEVLLEAAGGEELPLIPTVWRATGFDLLTGCRLACGDSDGAERAAGQACALAELHGLPLCAAMADRAAAAVALESGDAAGAAERALASAQRAEDVGAVIEAGVSRVLAGRALAAAGQTDQAVTELERAAAAFEAHDALGRRDQAERQLGRLGRRPHRRSRRGRVDGTGIESLTERELEVARLVVDRRTNSQIAAELFLSPKTVETHIRHLFQKLEVSSRVEVARVVERAERRAPEAAPQ